MAEICQMLTLSTAHLSEDTCNRWIASDCPWSVYKKGDYGWFMYVCDDVGISEGEDVPPEMQAALCLARTLGCVWIMFDCDGPEVEQLPTFDW